MFIKSIVNYTLATIWSEETFLTLSLPVCSHQSVWIEMNDHSFVRVFSICRSHSFAGCTSSTSIWINGSSNVCVFERRGHLGVDIINFGPHSHTKKIVENLWESTARGEKKNLLYVYLLSGYMRLLKQYTKYIVYIYIYLLG